MRSVVADTGPLHYLVAIHEIDLLPRMFDVVFLPAEVCAELLHSKAPAIVRTWAAHPPSWVTVSPTRTDDDDALQTLDVGECAAIVLSKSLRPDLILMDDRAGVAAAREAGFVVMGTLGLLDRAAQRGLVDLGAAFAALRATNFHLQPELLDLLLTRDRGRRVK